MFALLALAAGAAAFMPVDDYIDFAPHVASRTMRETGPDGRFVALLAEESARPAREIATSFMGHLGFAATEVEVTDSVPTALGTHVHVRQIVNGLAVANAVANVNVRPGGQVQSASVSFFTGAVTASLPRVAVLSADDAVARVAAFLGRPAGEPLSYDPIEAKLVYMQTENGNGLVLCHNFQVRLVGAADWFDVYVDAVSGELVAMINWTKYIGKELGTFNAFVPPVNDPADGDRSVVTAISENWNDQGAEVFETTIGNNCYAQENLDGSASWENNYRPTAASGLVFDYPLDEALEPVDNMDAAITNLFYVINWTHDFFYRLGFVEAVGNAQENNFGRGGLGGDANQANAQDGSGTNNANQSSPPDGSRPRTRMYVWTNPRDGPAQIDGDFENGIVIHEYLHMVSTRSVGGPSNSGCLGGSSAQRDGGSMGEAWSDFFPVAINLVKEAADLNATHPMGDWVRPGGIRPYPYSRNMETNPTTFDVLNTSQFSAVHSRGSYYCNVLFEVFALFVEEYGFNADLFSSEGGNNIFFQIAYDSMLLTPCSPSMLQARDALIEADQLRNGGAHYCMIWAAHAKRGMGIGATDTFRSVTEDFGMPSTC